MKMITVKRDCRIAIQQLPNKKYSVTIEPKRGVSVSKNGLLTIQECMQYADYIRKNFEE